MSHGAGEPVRPLVQMLAELDQKVQSDYDASADAAAGDPQQAGHVAEATWKRVLQEWLPSGYVVGLRKYIAPELNDDSFETDIVVFRPQVPQVLREHAIVPHGAVAAAFAVRRTADRAGLLDAIDRAARLRRSMDRAMQAEPERQVWPAYPVGFLALSHSWKGTPTANVQLVTGLLDELDTEVAQRPSESLDLCCIGELGAWGRHRVERLPGEAVRRFTGDESAGACPMTFLLDPLGGADGPPPTNPVGMFIREMYSALERNDPGLKELAYSLRKGVEWPSGSSPVRLWRE